MSRRVGRTAAWCVVAIVAAVAVVASPGATSPPLGLDEVLASVERHYPLLLAVEKQRDVAGGKLQAARGAFDTRLDAGALTAPEGFYENRQLDLSIEQPLRTWGLNLAGGYRLGRGDFAVYDGDLKTNLDGELSLGARLPLLRDRGIDDRRAKLRSAELGVERAEPLVDQQRLEARRKAELAYWEWLAAGEKNRIALSLIRLADDRQDALSASAEEGLIAEIVLVDNERLIAERRAIQVDTERRLQQAAIDLSLYLRDRDGNPQVPEPARLPRDFPRLESPTVDLERDLEHALVARPEPRKLGYERDNLAIQVARARNEFLPSVDLAIQASQDLGAAADVPDDKGEFEVKAGLSIELPLQRRAAKGTIRSSQAELERIEQQLRFARDRIGVEVRDAHSAWSQAYLRFEQARLSLELARELEEAERIQLDEGNSDLLRLNIRERQAAQAASSLVDAKAQYFEARNDYRAAIGLLPSTPRRIPD